MDNRDEASGSNYMCSGQLASISNYISGQWPVPVPVPGQFEVQRRSAATAGNAAGGAACGAACGAASGAARGAAPPPLPPPPPLRC